MKTRLRCEDEATSSINCARLYIEAFVYTVNGSIENIHSIDTILLINLHTSLPGFFIHLSCPRILTVFVLAQKQTSLSLFWGFFRLYACRRATLSEPIT